MSKLLAAVALWATIVGASAAADLPYDFRTDETFYTRFGDWFAWLCVIVSVILVGQTFLKKQNNEVTA